MNSVDRLRATYSFQPVDHLFRKEFSIWPEAVEKWQRSEGMPADADQAELFGWDEPAQLWLHGLGGCEPAFSPPMEEEVLEVTDEYEIARDRAGRTVKYFKGRRHGFMPTYLKHAVTNERDWEERIAPMLSPATPQRWADWDEHIAEAKANAVGRFTAQYCIGGYMYLRALVGPEDICYMFLDNPPLIHKMMKAWLELADAVTARVQQHVRLDELLLDEDICYNHGLLVSPDMVREFLLPYYQQLLNNIRSRQGNKRLFFHLATDGQVNEAIDLYISIGMDVMSPFEVAAGNDVVQIAKKYPNLVMTGGVDKRVLAEGPAAIDEYLDRVIPFMVKRGGYIPTCDHGVPDNVSYASYMHYRKKMIEMDHQGPAAGAYE